MIYFDNAATSFQKPEAVSKAVCRAIQCSGNALRGSHEAALASLRILFQTRSLLDQMFHPGGPEQAAFTSNATEALNTAIFGLFTPKDHVITTCLEHNSVLRPLFHLEEMGMELSIVKADEKGCPDYDQLEKMIGPKTKGIVMTHASNLTGNLTDLDRVGKICQKHDLYFVVDGSQTAGAFPIPMDRYHISVLCLTGHKGLLCPQGTGAILVKKGIKVRPLKMGGSGVLSYQKKQPDQMPEALEAGTLNVHGIAGLLAALQYINEIGIDKIREREQKLMRQFYEGIVGLPGIYVYGDYEQTERAPIVACNLGSWDSAAVSDELMERFHIATRPGAHCAPLIHECLGTKEQGAVRFSFSHFNTEEEVEQGIRAIQTLVEEEGKEKAGESV